MAIDEGKRVFTNLLKKDPVDIDSAMSRGDWSDAKEILCKGVDFIVDSVQKSGLQGRGGAGFSTGLKWGFMSKKISKTSYFVVNADESEPGTFKDRELLIHEPHKILEGILYSSFATNASVCYVYIRGEYYDEYKSLSLALREAKDRGFFGKNVLSSGYDLDVYIHRGAGAYVCGEETALLESLSGNKGLPRIKPPFPANIGLFGCPTNINNVETISYVPTILKKGYEWFSKIGTEKSNGTKLFCVSGSVNNPCVFEEEFGVEFKYIIDKYCKGVKGGWKNLLAVFPGGSSTPILKKSVCDKLTMDYETLKKVGSSLGTGGIIVMNKDVDLINAVLRISEFYAHESCGQCSPCREGTKWLVDILRRISESQAKLSDIDDIIKVADSIAGNTICALGDAAALPIKSLVSNFNKVIQERINGIKDKVRS